MSPASTLLRVLLMLSLLLNGANAAMAGEYLLHANQAAPAAASTPPCHTLENAGQADSTATHAPGTQAPADDHRCSMNDCARACSQLPMVGVALLPLPQGPWADAAPSGALHTRHPAPSLARVVRPPIA